jgi:hypothetical protein
MEWWVIPEVILVVFGAIGGVVWMVREYRLGGDSATVLLDHEGRISRLEGAVANESINDQLAELFSRVGTLEGRVDWRAVKHTARARDGKFTKKEE